MVHPCDMQDDRDDALIEVTHRLAAMRERESSQEYAVPDHADGWQRDLRSKDDLVAPPSPSTSSQDVSRPEGYLGCGGGSGDSSSLTSHGRIRQVRWYYEVVDSYDLDREIVSVAASYLDRYLASRAVDHRRLRLAGMIALYLAIKLHSRRKLRLSCFVRISRGTFTTEEFEEMELEMLETLRWRVNPVTPQAVCRELLHLLPTEGARPAIGETALFLTELSVCDRRLATKAPSGVALAAVALAIELRSGCSRDKVAFLKRAVDVGLADVVCNRGVGDCYWCLRGLYHESAGTAGAEGSPLEGSAESDCDPPVDRFLEDSPRGIDRPIHGSTRDSTSRRRRVRSITDAE